MRICICIKTGEEEKGVRNNVFRVACVVVCAFLAQKAFFFFFLLLFVLAGAGQTLPLSRALFVFEFGARESRDDPPRAHEINRESIRSL